MLFVGQLLKEARAAAGLTQAELARRLETSQPAIARLESQRSNPRLATLRRALEETGHRLELRVEPAPGNVDETMIVANLALSPTERLASFQAAYRSVSSLTAQARPHG